MLKGRAVGAVKAWWTIDEVAASLGVDRVEAFRMVEEGPLEGSWIGDELMVHCDALAKLSL